MIGEPKLGSSYFAEKLSLGSNDTTSRQSHLELGFPFVKLSDKKCAIFQSIKHKKNNVPIVPFLNFPA